MIRLPKFLGVEPFSKKEINEVQVSIQDATKSSKRSVRAERLISISQQVLAKTLVKKQQLLAPADAAINPVTPKNCCSCKISLKMFPSEKKVFEPNPTIQWHASALWWWAAKNLKKCAKELFWPDKSSFHSVRSKTTRPFCWPHFSTKNLTKIIRMLYLVPNWSKKWNGVNYKKCGNLKWSLCVSRTGERELNQGWRQ